MSIKSRVEEIRQRAERDFAQHEVLCVLDNGTHKHYRVDGKDGFNWYEVIIFPSYFIIVGDLGDYVFHRSSTDMLKWMHQSVDSIGYLAEKIEAGSWKDEFDHEVAAEWIEEERVVLNAERHDAIEVEDKEEIRRIDAKLEVLENLEVYLDNSYAFTEMVYNEYSDGDCEMLDSFWNYSYSFLWCREAIRFLLERI